MQRWQIGKIIFYKAELASLQKRGAMLRSIVKRITPFNITMFIVMVIGLNMILPDRVSSTSIAARVAEFMGAPLYIVGSAIIFGMLLASASPNDIRLRFIGKLPYWVFCSLSAYMAVKYNLSSLGVALYVGYGLHLLVHWLYDLLRMRYEIHD